MVELVSTVAYRYRSFAFRQFPFTEGTGLDPKVRESEEKTGNDEGNCSLEGMGHWCDCSIRNVSYANGLA